MNWTCLFLLCLTSLGNHHNARYDELTTNFSGRGSCPVRSKHRQDDWARNSTREAISSVQNGNVNSLQVPKSNECLCDMFWQKSWYLLKYSPLHWSMRRYVSRFRVLPSCYKTFNDFVRVWWGLHQITTWRIHQQDDLTTFLQVVFRSTNLGKEIHLDLEDNGEYVWCYVIHGLNKIFIW